MHNVQESLPNLNDVNVLQLCQKKKLSVPVLDINHNHPQMILWCAFLRFPFSARKKQQHIPAFYIKVILRVQKMQGGMRWCAGR